MSKAFEYPPDGIPLPDLVQLLRAPVVTPEGLAAALAVEPLTFAAQGPEGRALTAEMRAENMRRCLEAGLARHAETFARAAAEIEALREAMRRGIAAMNEALLDRAAMLAELATLRTRLADAEEPASAGWEERG